MWDVCCCFKVNYGPQGPLYILDSVFYAQTEIVSHLNCLKNLLFHQSTEFYYFLNITLDSMNLLWVVWWCSHSACFTLSSPQAPQALESLSLLQRSYENHLETPSVKCRVAASKLADGPRSLILRNLLLTSDWTSLMVRVLIPQISFPQ